MNEVFYLSDKRPKLSNEVKLDIEEIKKKEKIANDIINFLKNNENKEFSCYKLKNDMNLKVRSTNIKEILELLVEKKILIKKEGKRTFNYILNPTSDCSIFKFEETKTKDDNENDTDTDYNSEEEYYTYDNFYFD